MRLKSVILGTASVLVLTSAALASAQTAPQTAPAGTASTDPLSAPAGATPAAAQDAARTDAQAEAAPDDAADPGEDIVVTGLRASLRSAQNIKRNSDQQVDSIVAQDIGKLPDVAVSDVAARIPGVQVDRGGGEANRVLVRGLPDFATTFNGREIFTADARAVALQDFPAGAIAAIEVFKTTTADLVEGGLAGEINVRSRKPFDFDGLEVAGSLWGQYQKRSGKYDPNGNLLIADRWETGIGEVGALLNFSYTSLHYLDSERSNTDFIARNVGGTGLNAPDIQRVRYGEGKRTRPSLNGAVQWRPAPGIELYAEGLWQGFRNRVSDRETSINLYDGAAYTNATPQAGTTLIDSITVTNPRRPDGFQGATYSKTDTYQFAMGGKYDGGPLHVAADLARTSTRFTNSIYSFDTAWAAPATVTANTGLSGVANGPAVTFGPGTDPTSAANYIYRGFFDRRQVSRGKDWQGRLDVSLDTGVSAIPTIAFGVRYVDRDAHYEEGNRYASLEGQNLPLGAIPVDYHVSRSGFPDDDPSGLRGYYTPTYRGLRSNVAKLRELSGFAAGVPPINPAATYDANETSYALYEQVKYALGSTDGVRADGAIGLRIVSTKLSLAGTSVDAGVGTPVGVDRSYWDWLPNANARIRFTDQLQLRLSATRTRTRPNFSQYNPAVSVDAPISCQTPGNAGYIPPTDPNAFDRCFRNGTIGNANLSTLKSRNYDASFEYYFSRTGSAAVAVFRRDLGGFITTYAVDAVDAQGYRVRLNQPFNSGKGRIEGVEAQFNTFLDIAGLPSWLRAFGVEANVTYLDAKTGLPAQLGGVITQTPIIGVSKWTYNLSGIYETGGLTARLSWNHRGRYLGTTQQRDVVRDAGGAITAFNTYTETVRGIDRLDLSASYDLFANLTLTADATNLLAKPFRSDLNYAYADGTDAGFPRVVRYEESVYSLGARFRF